MDRKLGFEAAMKKWRKHGLFAYQKLKNTSEKVCFDRKIYSCILRGVRSLETWQIDEVGDYPRRSGR